MASLIDTVIVLGAGASKAEGMPMQAEMLHRFWARVRTGELTSLAQADAFERSVLAPLRDYFEAFFALDLRHYDPGHVEFPSFEEALGVLDIALARGEEYAEFSTERLLAMRRALVDTIIVLLTVDARDASRHHERLLKQLRASGRLDRVGFISLNYDLVLDTAALLRAELLDYGVRFREDLSRDRAFREAQGPRVPLYKLHGSLNWALCAACRALDFSGTVGVAQAFVPGFNHQIHVCRCGSMKQAVVVPPTFFKSLTAMHLAQVWQAAEELLREARHVVFCGYSFPEADIHFKRMLKAVQMHKRSGAYPPLESVRLVIHHADKAPQRCEEEANRYRRFLGANVALHTAPVCFEAFADAPDAFLEA